MWLLIALAFAVPEDRFPWSAEVELPATGVHRVRVPAELRPAWSDDSSGLALLDANGTVVPFAAVVTDETPTRIAGQRGTPDGTVALEWWPAPDGDGWELAVRQRPADGLEVLLPRTPFATNATLYEWVDGAWVERARQVVWRLGGSAVSAPIPLPPRTGRFKVVLDPGAVEIDDAPAFTIVRHDTSVPETTLDLEVLSTQVPDTGWVQYDIGLPQPLAVEWLEVQTDASLFDRRVALEFVEPSEAPDALGYVHVPYSAQTIQRTSLGGAQIDRVRVKPEGSPSRRLALYVEAQGQEPLPIERVTVALPGLDLLVQDPGPGPHTLLAGAPRSTMAPSDLQFAGPELARLAGEPVQPGARLDNPAYVPPEERGGLVTPSQPLDLRDYTRAWPVQGAGLVRIALTDEVLANARPDLGDLRLIDAEGRQIPYLLQDDGTLHTWGSLPFERTERESQSVLEVTLPQPNVLVGVVTLSTEAPLFDREVRLSRPSAGRLETMRAIRWSGLDRPSTVSIALSQRVGDTLVVQIENGDDPPLPITAIEAAWPGWELLAVVPDGGARLVAGAPRETRPDYDLWLLREQLRDRVDTGATLGPAEVLVPPPLSLLDRGLVGFGVAVLALGLLGLTVVLIRGAPEEPAPPAPEEDEPEADPPEPAPA